MLSYSISSQFNVFNCTVVFYESVESDKLVQVKRFEYAGVTCLFLKGFKYTVFLC